MTYSYTIITNMDGPSPESPTYIVSFVFKKLFELVTYSYCVVCWQRQKWQLESLMLHNILKRSCKISLTIKNKFCENMIVT